MLFTEFIGCIESQVMLEEIHQVLKRFACFNFNVQCVGFDEEYHRWVDQHQLELAIDEREPGIYDLYHKSRKIMVINLANRLVWDVTGNH